MVSPEVISRIQKIHAQATSLGYTLDRTPPSERATVVRGLLLNHCLQLRAIINTGTTHAAGIPIIDILRDTQQLMLDFRALRKQQLH